MPGGLLGSFVQGKFWKVPRIGMKIVCVNI